jgi:hypothetical protein
MRFIVLEVGLVTHMLCVHLTFLASLMLCCSVVGEHFIIVQ